MIQYPVNKFKGILFMKKVRTLTVVLIAIAIFLTIAAISVEIVIHAGDIENAFWNAIAKEFEKEQAEIDAKVARGEPFYGKDTIVIWDNMYELAKVNNDKVLCIQTKDVSNDIIGKVQKFKTKKGKHFVLSDEGYVVIDKDSLCRVYITVPDEEFVNGYYADAYGNKTYISRKHESKYVSYLSSYDEFSEEERKVFEEMQQPKTPFKKRVSNFFKGLFGIMIKG